MIVIIGQASHTTRRFIDIGTNELLCQRIELILSDPIITTRRLVQSIDRKGGEAGDLIKEWNATKKPTNDHPFPSYLLLLLRVNRTGCDLQGVVVEHKKNDHKQGGMWNIKRRHRKWSDNVDAVIYYLKCWLFYLACAAVERLPNRFLISTTLWWRRRRNGLWENIITQI